MKTQALRILPVNDCWNSAIGLHGDRSCDKLVEHVHCRNCPVYTEGARTVMQRALPAGYRSDWAVQFAAPEPVPVATDRAALVFRIGCEWLSLPAASCVTVAEMAPAHRLPHRDNKILTGIVNVKGRLYPCMSLAALMELGSEEPPLLSGRQVYARLLVVQLAQHAFALPVQELHGIHRHAAVDLRATPATVHQAAQRYLTGVLDIEGLKVGCLDAELIGYQLAGALQ